MSRTLIPISLTSHSRSRCYSSSFQQVEERGITSGNRILRNLAHKGFTSWLPVLRYPSIPVITKKRFSRDTFHPLKTLKDLYFQHQMRVLLGVMLADVGFSICRSQSGECCRTSSFCLSQFTIWV